ncbi:glycosyltransferase [Pontibacillus salipaludis]|uniref:glycosyltransferase n=1 Tax=Pontibacillus salipaludis TaxID=1697394 RepID=UPI0031E5D49B
MTFITLCMIVRDEEVVIERCLESVYNAVDEIVIVDTGSTDSTKELASRYTDNIYSIKWTGDFSEARNFAQSKANGKWILVLDADEYVDYNNLKEVIENLKTADQLDEAYIVNIYNFTGAYGEKIVKHNSIRIFRNDSEIKYSRRIHEQIQKKEGQLKTNTSNLIVYHSGYLNRTVIEKNKSERNLPLLESEMNNSNNTAFDYFNLGNEYGGRGEIEKALNAYVKAYKMKPDFKYSWVSFCLIQIINCLITLKRYNDALQVIQDAEKIYINSPDFKCLKANVFLLQNRFIDAMEPLDDVLNNEEKYSNCITSIDYKEYRPHQMLGEIYRKIGDDEKAVFHFVKALNYNSSCFNSLYKLMETLARNCTYDEIVSFVQNNGFINDEINLHKLIKIFISLKNIDLANKYISLIKEDNLSKKGYEIKIDLIHGNGLKLESFLGEGSLEELNYMIGKGCFDIYDLILFGFVNNDKLLLDLLEKLIEEEREENLINFLVNNGPVNKLIKEGFAFLVERTLQYRRLDLFKKLTDCKTASSSEMNILIANLLYSYDFKAEAVNYYKKVDPNYYDDQTLVNLVNFNIDEQKEYKLASEWIISAISAGKLDYRLFECALKLHIEGEEKYTWDINNILEIAFQQYPGSQNLVFLNNIIQDQQQNETVDSSSKYIVGFFLETAFHYYVYESIINGLLNKNVECHLVINDNYNENPEMKEMYNSLIDFIHKLERTDLNAYTISMIRENSFIYDAMVSCYYSPLIENVAKKQVRAMYSLAKDYWTYSWWNVFYDKILCFGDYDYKKLNIYNNCSIVGNPKFDNWHRGKINIDQVKKKFLLDENKQNILYAPTYGHLSSIDDWFDEIRNLQENYNIIIKLHHGTAFRESEHLRRDKLNQGFENITTDSEDLFGLFSISDYVITDNSGMIFDSILAGQNTLLLNSEFQPKIDQNGTEQKIRDSLININKGMNIQGILGDEELLTKNKKQISKLVKKYYKITSGYSGELASSEILGLLTRGENDENTLLLSLRKQIFGY